MSAANKKTSSITTEGNIKADHSYNVNDFVSIYKNGYGNNNNKSKKTKSLVSPKT
jgi:hypothetical protein